MEQSPPPPGQQAVELQTRCFGEIQTILVCAGIASSILWPESSRSDSKALEGAGEARGRRLRRELNIPDSSPLRKKVLRNAVEHIDERFEEYYARYGGGTVRDFSLLLNPPPSFELPSTVTRAYSFPQSNLWLFGDRQNLEAISRALWDTADGFSIPVRSGKYASEAGSTTKADATLPSG